ncbi:N-acetylmuramoyl-L-alanine amidase [Bradyrhizobium sp. 149]|uniref:N-acetylmuramoyl-L-alanine amidase n=1 Tax=Bradyrhizobium sp. 149 TaxID=2782624 RepID=UPI001FFBBBC9|nr:N-acetylmuramoyl-L-alanine amidase [Bradyrhizobium sp. 149]MCK1651370.1 N-acetylmuramoyl-L-alanine amidase [Bradyrhizobium sp. 149]
MNELLLRLADIYAGENIRHPQLRAVTLAQWMLESGRATSKLATEHYNFGGLKWRKEMAAYATRVLYQAHDGDEYYCKFATIENFINGYWAFLNRAPYSGWEEHIDSGEDFIRFIGPIYTPKPSYPDDVLVLVKEAQRLLSAPPRTHLVAAVAAVNLGTVVIDPGHGGTVKVGGSSPNNATSASGVKEKKLALDFSLILRDELLRQATASSQTIKVVLTRTTDVNVGITDRAQVAASEHARAFLCLHFNGLDDTTISGAETYFRAASNGNLNLQADIKFANAVHDGLMAGMRAVNPTAKDRGVKPDSDSGPGSLGVLNDAALGNTPANPRCASAYIEAEFISNPKVDKILISGADAIANRTQVMASVATAIREFLAGA